MKEFVKKILIDEKAIAEKIEELGRRITKDYEGKEVIFIGILRGSVVFMADLIRKVDLPCKLDFMSMSSYEGTSSTGAVKIKKDLTYDIENKDVIVVEDIVDTGTTLNYLRDYLKLRNPRSLKFCTLLDKPSRRKVVFNCDYSGFTIPNEFVIGFGLDYNESYRNLPYVAVLDEKFINED